MAAAAAILALAAGGGTFAGCGSDSSAGGTSTENTSTLAAANGVETLSAQEILDASGAAATKATSVRVKGTITMSAQTVTLDLQVGKNSADGTVSAAGVDVEIRVVGGKSYFKISPESFAAMAGQEGSAELIEAMKTLIGDKWLLVPVDSASGDFDDFNKLAQKDLLITALLAPEGTITVKGTDTINGVPVVLLSSSKGGTLAISTVGEPYPIQMSASDDEGTGTLDFTGWNEPFDVTAPTDVLDISALAGLAT